MKKEKKLGKRKSHTSITLAAVLQRPFVHAPWAVMARGGGSNDGRTQKTPKEWLGISLTPPNPLEPGRPIQRQATNPNHKLGSGMRLVRFQRTKLRSPPSYNIDVRFWPILKIHMAGFSTLPP